MRNIRTVVVNGTTLTFTAVDVTAPLVIHQITGKSKPVDIEDIGKVEHIAEVAKQAGFTHHNPDLGLWAAFPPEPSTDENVPPVVLIDTPFIAVLYPRFPLSTQYPCDWADGESEVIHHDYLATCVQATFDSKVRVEAEQLNDPSAIRYLAVHTNMSDSTRRSILTREHGVWDTLKEMLYPEDDEVIERVGANASPELLSELVSGFAATHVPRSKFGSPEERNDFFDAVDRMLHIVRIAARDGEGDVTVEANWDALWNVVYAEHLAFGRELTINALYALARRSSQAELDLTGRETFDSPFPDSPNETVAKVSRVCGDFIDTLIRSMVSNPNVHPSTLEFFAFCDNEDVREEIIEHPKTSRRLRTLLTSTLTVS